MHNADAAREAVAVVRERDLFAIEAKLTRIRLVDAGHDFDRGAFACAVLAHETVDFCGTKSERNIIKRAHAGEGFRDVSQFEHLGNDE